MTTKAIEACLSEAVKSGAVSEADGNAALDELRALQNDRVALGNAEFRAKEAMADRDRTVGVVAEYGTRLADVSRALYGVAIGVDHQLRALNRKWAYLEELASNARSRGTVDLEDAMKGAEKAVAGR